MNIVEISDVSYTYRNKFQQTKALEQVSFTIQEGYVYSITGKSGSGKSTLLSMLAGLMLPTTGEILYLGTSTRKLNLDEYRRNHVSVIYQAFHLFPLLTVLENVIYPLELKKIKIQKAKEIAKKHLESVGLDESYYHRFPNMISGGEKQRVAIARALATGSKIILADEPTGNLDENNGKIVVDLLTKLAHEHNLAVVIVTHDMEIAKNTDMQIQIRDGKVVNNF
jgi:ABC-type lipoprotein export system ATPase subunit